MNGIVLTGMTGDCSVFNDFSRLLISSCNIWVSGDNVSLELDIDISQGLYNKTSLF